jgi:hypothetical protein
MAAAYARGMVRLLVILACLWAGPARADGFYFTESFGGSDVKSDLAAYIPSAVHVRIALGMRSGAWALETHIGAHIGNGQGTAPDDRPRWTYGLDLKYIQPMSKHFEAYLRGGLRYGSMDDGSPIDSYSGRGLGGGAGLQFKGKVRALGFLCFPFFFMNIGPKITGALWVDASYSFYRLHPDGRLDVTPAIDAKITTLSGGFAVGSDF